MNDLQNQLLSELSTDIRAGIIKVFKIDADVFSNLSAKFPVRSSGVAWEMVTGRRFKPSPHPKGSIDDYLPTIREFLTEFAKDAHVHAGEIVSVVGDAVTDLAFRMPFEVLVRHVRSLFSIPQHWYVVKDDYSWCFAYTFEDDMYFGQCPSSQLK